MQHLEYGVDYEIDDDYGVEETHFNKIYVKAVGDACLHKMVSEWTVIGYFFETEQN
jgi:hypothetical protein